MRSPGIHYIWYMVWYTKMNPLPQSQVDNRGNGRNLSELASIFQKAVSPLMLPLQLCPLLFVHYRLYTNRRKESNPTRKHRIQPEQADGMGRPNPSRETTFSGANGDREIFIFPVKRTTSRICNHTRLIHSLLNVLTIRPQQSVFLYQISSV